MLVVACGPGTTPLSRSSPGLPGGPRGVADVGRARRREAAPRAACAPPRGESGAPEDQEPATRTRWPASPRRIDHRFDQRRLAEPCRRRQRDDAASSVAQPTERLVERAPLTVAFDEVPSRRRAVGPQQQPRSGRRRRAEPVPVHVMNSRTLLAARRRPGETFGVVGEKVQGRVPIGSESPAPDTVRERYARGARLELDTTGAARTRALRNGENASPA